MQRKNSNQNQNPSIRPSNPQGTIAPASFPLQPQGQALPPRPSDPAPQRLSFTAFQPNSASAAFPKAALTVPQAKAKPATLTANTNPASRANPSTASFQSTPVNEYTMLREQYMVILAKSTNIKNDSILRELALAQNQNEAYIYQEKFVRNSKSYYENLPPVLIPQINPSITLTEKISKFEQKYDCTISPSNHFANFHKEIDAYKNQKSDQQYKLSIKLQSTQDKITALRISEITLKTNCDNAKKIFDAQQTKLNQASNTTNRTSLFANLLKINNPSVSDAVYNLPDNNLTRAAEYENTETVALKSANRAWATAVDNLTTCQTELKNLEEQSNKITEKRAKITIQLKNVDQEAAELYKTIKQGELHEAQAMLNQLCDKFKKTIHSLNTAISNIEAEKSLQLITNIHTALVQEGSILTMGLQEVFKRATNGSPSLTYSERLKNVSELAKIQKANELIPLSPISTRGGLFAKGAEESRKTHMEARILSASIYDAILENNMEKLESLLSQHTNNNITPSYGITFN